MKTRIQIIDDNVALTTLLAKALHKFGYDPVVENNPLLAINTTRHYMPDLILLDVMMPERDGGRVLADLRADLSLRYIPVILLTAIAREARGLANTGGIESAILSKPVQIKELITEIEAQLERARLGPDGPALPLREEPPAPSHYNELPDFDRPDNWNPRAMEPAPSFFDMVDDKPTINPSDVGFSADFPKPDFSFPTPEEDRKKDNPW